MLFSHFYLIFAFYIYFYSIKCKMKVNKENRYKKV